MSERHWIDVGAVACVWGGVNKEYTCVAPTSKEATRRDYVFSNPQALPLIQDFQVNHNVNMLVHSMLVAT